MWEEILPKELADRMPRSEKHGGYEIVHVSDYPHLEGTFGHTQKTLHELFDSVDPNINGYGWAHSRNCSPT